MPSELKIIVERACDLPIMDTRNVYGESSTDAFVEVKVDNQIQKTHTCAKNLNPIWNKEFKFLVANDSVLQDAPVELRCMDQDYVNEVIGVVYIDLNPLIMRTTTHGSERDLLISGWFPLFDTLRGVRGSLKISIKLQFIGNDNPFRESSAGVQFFSASTLSSDCFVIQEIIGFVEDLVVEDDPESSWQDYFRKANKASNDSRLKVLYNLSAEARRELGKKVIAAGGNAVLGYSVHFDIEGPSGIVARANGTACQLLKVADSSQTSHFLRSSFEQLSPWNYNWSLLRHDQGRIAHLDRECAEILSPQLAQTLSSVTGVSGDQMLVLISAIDESIGSITPLFPFGIGNNDKVLTMSSAVSKDTILTSRMNMANKSEYSTIEWSAANKVTMITTEIQLITLTSLPSNTKVKLGGLVLARSIKFLGKLEAKLSDQETREGWWEELRENITSHAKVLFCKQIIGYTETCTIFGDVCVLSAIGTAAVLKSIPGPIDLTVHGVQDAMANSSIQHAPRDTLDNEDKGRPRFLEDEDDEDDEEVFSNQMSRRNRLQYIEEVHENERSPRTDNSMIPPLDVLPRERSQSMHSHSSSVHSARSIKDRSRNSSDLSTMEGNANQNRNRKHSGGVHHSSRDSSVQRISRDTSGGQNHKDISKNDYNATVYDRTTDMMGYSNQQFEINGNISQRQPSKSNFLVSNSKANQSFLDVSSKVSSRKRREPKSCAFTHIPYNHNIAPFGFMRLVPCLSCKRKWVPETILASVEPPMNVCNKGKGQLMETRVCRSRRAATGEADATKISEVLPFVEYDLQRQLMLKLKILGVNSAFGYRCQMQVGSDMVIAIATCTAIYLESLPPPPPLQIMRSRTIMNATNNPQHDQRMNKIQKDVIELIKLNKQSLDGDQENSTKDSSFFKKSNPIKQHKSHSTHHLHSTYSSNSISNPISKDLSSSYKISSKGAHNHGSHDPPHHRNKNKRGSLKGLSGSDYSMNPTDNPLQTAVVSSENNNSLSSIAKPLRNTSEDVMGDDADHDESSAETASTEDTASSSTSSSSTQSSTSSSENEVGDESSLESPSNPSTARSSIAQHDETVENTPRNISSPNDTPHEVETPATNNEGSNSSMKAAMASPVTNLDVIGRKERSESHLSTQSTAGIKDRKNHGSISQNDGVDRVKLSTKGSVKNMTIHEMPSQNRNQTGQPMDDAYDELIKKTVKIRKRVIYKDDRPPFIFEIDDETDVDLFNVLSDWKSPVGFDMVNISFVPGGSGLSQTHGKTFTILRRGKLNSPKGSQLNTAMSTKNMNANQFDTTFGGNVLNRMLNVLFQEAYLRLCFQIKKSMYPCQILNLNHYANIVEDGYVEIFLSVTVHETRSLSLGIGSSPSTHYERHIAVGVSHRGAPTLSNNPDSFSAEVTEDDQLTSMKNKGNNLLSKSNPSKGSSRAESFENIPSSSSAAIGNHQNSTEYDAEINTLYNPLIPVGMLESSRSIEDQVFKSASSPSFLVQRGTSDGLTESLSLPMNEDNFNNPAEKYPPMIGKNKTVSEMSNQDFPPVGILTSSVSEISVKSHQPSPPKGNQSSRSYKINSSNDSYVSSSNSMAIMPPSTLLTTTNATSTLNSTSSNHLLMDNALNNVTSYSPSISQNNVIITSLSSIPNARVKRYLGPIQLHYIKDSWNVRGEGMMGAFYHLFVSEANAIAKSHVAALGGNALLCHRLIPQESGGRVTRNQAYNMISVTGDAVLIELIT